MTMMMMMMMMMIVVVAAAVVVVKNALIKVTPQGRGQDFVLG